MADYVEECLHDATLEQLWCEICKRSDASVLGFRDFSHSVVFRRGSMFNQNRMISDLRSSLFDEIINVNQRLNFELGNV